MTQLLALANKDFKIFKINILNNIQEKNVMGEEMEYFRRAMEMLEEPDRNLKLENTISEIRVIRWA